MVLRRLAILGVAAALLGAACEEHTVAIRFDPDVGDRYRFRSEIVTEVERELDGERTGDSATAILDATETVMEVGDDTVTVEVTVDRDTAPTRTYEVRYDRGGRLSAIDLVEGVPTAALGVQLATELPPDVASPPDGRLEPGARWDIDRTFGGDGGDGPSRVTGTGRVDSLGVEDGRDVAVIVVDLEVPVRSTVDTDDGRVTIVGVQRSRSRTTYDLADGAPRRDRTDIEGSLDVLVEPPAGVTAAPIPGRIVYRVETRTLRQADG